MLIGIPQLFETISFGRMDEVKAARELVLCCWLPEGYDNE